MLDLSTKPHDTKPDYIGSNCQNHPHFYCQNAFSPKTLPQKHDFQKKITNYIFQKNISQKIFHQITTIKSAVS